MTDFGNLALVQLILLAVQGAIYFFCQYAAKHPHYVGGALDQKIPFIPAFIFLYLSWFPLLIGAPFLYARYAASSCAEYLGAIVAMIAICIVVYLVYPTIIERPEPPESRGLVRFLVASTYSVDRKSVNCIPSIHCTVSFLNIYFAFACLNVPLILKLVMLVWCLGICASTLLVKQHAIIDIVWAAVLTAACIPISIFLLSDPVLRLICR